MVNWTKLEKDYPNSFPLVQEFAKTYKGKGSPPFKYYLLNDFVESQGHKGYPMFIYGLRKIEADLAQKANQASKVKQLRIEL